MQFSLLDLKMNGTCDGQSELHPPHLINVAVLHCESRNTKNVILQWDSQRKLHRMYHNFIKADQGHDVP